MKFALIFSLLEVTGLILFCYINQYHQFPSFFVLCNLVSSEQYTQTEQAKCLSKFDLYSSGISVNIIFWFLFFSSKLFIPNLTRG